MLGCRAVALPSTEQIVICKKKYSLQVKIFMTVSLTLNRHEYCVYIHILKFMGINKEKKYVCLTRNA